ncbi:MAG TPA: hypothetical protein VFV58_34255, partial [Blastocatellia bacterium]|nr:hypothetical protein [Blastocatellia bacterium]
MRRCVRFFPVILAALAMAASGSNTILRQASAQGGALGAVQKGGGQKSGPATLSVEAQQQITAILKEKQSRTKEERKVSPQLLYAMRALRGEPMTAKGEVSKLNTAMSIANSAMDASQSDHRVPVTVKAAANKELIMAIDKLGGLVQFASEKDGVIHALMPLGSLLELASLDSVKKIMPAAFEKMLHSQMPGANRMATPFGMNGATPDFNRRAMNVRTNLKAALAKFGPRAAAQDQTTNAGSVTSKGDVAHNAAAARNFFGVSGAGVKIGVLSDSVDFLAQSIATGDLPPDVTVLPGQSGVPGTGEGTAMLEIVHDMAPSAKLFFATAFTSIESFADNIRALRAAGCDIIVDDIIYFAESPFHDDIVSTAVNDVIADGALYFSSAGNEGN